MKKVFLIVFGLFCVVLLTLFIVPLLYKDKVVAMLQKELDKQLTAKIELKPENISLSLLRDFPSLSVLLEDFKIEGQDKFEGVNLLEIKTFALGMDVMSVVSGDEIVIDHIILEKPSVHVKVLEDGSANYDIMAETTDVPVEETPTEESTGSGPSIKIEKWSISEGVVRYEDPTMPVEVLLTDLNHSGGGSFSDNIFSMLTKTTIDKSTITFDGVSYFNESSVDANINLDIDLDKMHMTFKENYLKVNEFSIGADGWFEMPETGFEMDLRFGSKDNSFKSLLSIVPGMYKSDFKDLETSGDLKFGGEVKGVMDDNNMPAFNFALKVDNGYFHYPDLPSSVEKVFVDLKVDNKDGVPEHTDVDVNNFSLEVAKSPIKGSFHLKQLDAYSAMMQGAVDLAVIQTVFPMDSMSFSGNIDLDAKVDGYVSDESFEKLKASGKMEASKIKFESVDLPQGFGIEHAKITLSPSQIKLEDYKGNVGKSDLTITGFIDNYMGYALKDELLKSNLNVESQVLDLNEWMSEEETVATEEETTTEEVPDSLSMQVEALPSNISFVATAKAKTVKYTNLDLEDFTGRIELKDGVLSMKKLYFNLLGGAFQMDGKYDPRNTEKPLFDASFKIKQLSFKKSYESFVTVQKFSPIAKNIEGDFSADMNISGLLNGDYSPNYESLFGKGGLQVVQAQLKGVKALNSISELTNIKELNDPSIKDIDATGEIKNGKLYVDPFDVDVAGIKTNISGTNSIEGDIDYNIQMNLEGTSYSQYLPGVSSVKFKVSGTYDNPKIKPEYGDIASEVKKQISDETKKATSDALKDLQKQAADGDIDKDSLEKNLKKTGEDLLNNLFKKKKK
ncbi:AsmA family protein [Sediminitomix flava]|uniref:AsmA-like protein n=1 Tax=Sediminitomix flava TaxID=379075 RepID=A0A315ZD72_SEDFL|nr:AsmA family protein [Sediminitomix flava]PWJ42654.1 AsmA-like protein [Sediminitomix flava]